MTAGEEGTRLFRGARKAVIILIWDTHWSGGAHGARERGHIQLSQPLIWGTHWSRGAHESRGRGYMSIQVAHTAHSSSNMGHTLVKRGT